ncbi:hypothetical protein AC622_19975, partial [Bacillus sp. FJAT-27916]|uniref:hypothetical protein n=1 Tax=Bacillus sp. FJAT-27916 TaxID=1679169 RepID=UPI000671783E
TRKLSSSAPMVVGAHAPVRVGRCRASETSSVVNWFFVFYIFSKENIKVDKVYPNWQQASPIGEKQGDPEGK